MSAIERTATVAAPPDAVWAVLADFGAISGWVPMIEHSCLLSDRTDGVGAVRRVQIARQTLIERVTTWDEPRELAYDIEGLPSIVGTARSTWRVTPVASGSTVVLTNEIDTGRSLVKILIATRVLGRMAMASEVMLAGLTGAVDPLAEQEQEVAS